MPSLLSPDRTYLHEWDEARYRRAFLFGQVAEEKVQEDIRSAFGYLRDVSIDWVDVGGAAIRGKFYGAMRRCGIPEVVAKKVLSLLGGVSAGDKGRSDLSGVLGPSGRAFFIEVKAPAWINPKTGGQLRPAGVPSPEQLAYLDGKAKLGALVGVAWSVEDALKIVGR
jgi:hypothetical protein